MYSFVVQVFVCLRCIACGKDGKTGRVPAHEVRLTLLSSRESFSFHPRFLAGVSYHVDDYTHTQYWLFPLALLSWSLDGTGETNGFPTMYVRAYSHLLKACSRDQGTQGLSSRGVPGFLGLHLHMDASGRWLVWLPKLHLSPPRVDRARHQP